MMKIAAILVVLISLVAADNYAACYLQGTNNNPTMKGSIIFYETNGAVRMTVNITGITVNPDSEHGIHVHQYGDLSNIIDGSSAGGHWNPNGSSHGCPPTSRHFGDTGNWNATGGSIVGEKFLDLLSFSGIYSVIGRAVVVHQGVDDCNNTLSAGSRLGFCVIGIQNVASNPAVQTANVSSAICNLVGTDGRNISGVVTFSQPNGEGYVTVTAKVYGLTGTHGFHIHEFGDLADYIAAQSVGGHYNPFGNNHYLPGYSNNSHLGDMGNIYHYEGEVAYYQYLNTIISLNGLYNVIGRAVLVHATEDLCTVPSAGGRWAYCVIGIQNPATVVTFPGTIPTTQDYSACNTGTTGSISTGPALTTAPLVSTTHGAHSSSISVHMRYTEIVAALFFALLILIVM